MPRRIPPSTPDCADRDSTDTGDAPRIASPLRGVTYALRSASGTEAIPLDAGTSGDVRQVFWFDGNELIGSGPGGKSLRWRPTAEGMHPIRVIDDRGRTAERDVAVQFTR
jgi:membrane carboxypeptidase/penicillin-binding protein PbpC